MDGIRRRRIGGAWRTLRAALTAVAVAAASFGWSAHVAVAGTAKPNIVFILTDDMRFDSLSTMPNVQSLLRGHGVTFSNMFVNDSLCCPSRATFLTGQTSGHTDVWQLWPPHGGFVTFTERGDDRSTIATWLHAAGYRTGLFGKYLNTYNGFFNGNAYVPPGWDDWFAFTKEGPGEGYYYDYGAMVRHTPVQFGHAPGDYGTDQVATRAEDFIRNARAPFFAYIAPYAPHRPAIPAPADWNSSFARGCGPSVSRPPSFNEGDVSDKPAYVRHFPRFSDGEIDEIDATHGCQLATLKDVDRMVAQIVQILQDKNELANTMIVFSSDNGFLWGEHRWAEKRVPYEESIHVPLVIRFDPMTSTARATSRLVSNIDLAPTWAALAGVTPATPVDGVSLLPLLKGPVSTWRSVVLIEYMQGTAMSKGRPDPVTSYCGLRTVPTPKHPHAFAYVVYRTGEQELYTVDTDPYELVNQASRARFKATVAAFHRRLAALCRPTPPDFPGGRLPGT